ncbi:MAG TPA: NAD(P)-dependent oxidoreductase [Polyangiaceae bacterium]|jgi:3-hydroxyisobutyrate dehydrogenase-like beta-hydroxyacid dehydrogenase
MPSSRPPARETPQEPAPIVGVAFLGLGAMGVPMARRLAPKFPLTVWNRTKSRADALEGAARVATSPRDAARGASVVVTCVADGKALEEVLGGEDGMLAGIDPDAVLVEMSTIGRAAAREAARAVEAKGARFVDAPVSGSVGPAQRGELLAMVGGADADVARVTPVLEAMCARILRAGGVGQGQALKVVLNGVGAHHFVAFASMLALGERAGLSRETVVDAFTSGAFASPSYVGKRAKVLAREYDHAEFTLALALKDGALNLALQQEVGLTLPVQREIAREVAQAVAEGLGDEDLFAMEKYFQRKG